MQPTIKKAESERAKSEKKEEKKTKKFKADQTKEQMTEAKAADKAMKAEFKNEAAGASLKAFPKPKASLAQKTQKKKVIKLVKKTKVALTQQDQVPVVEDPVSKEDQEEAEQAKTNLINEAKLAKNEEALKDEITAEEKVKTSSDVEYRESSNEGMIPTTAEAEKKSEEETKKHDKKIDEEVKKISKKQADEAKKTDEALKKEMETANPKKAASLA